MPPRKTKTSASSAPEPNIALTQDQKALAIQFIDNLQLWILRNGGAFPYAPYERAMEAYLTAKKAREAEEARQKAEADKQAKIDAAAAKKAAKERAKQEREEAKEQAKQKRADAKRAKAEATAQKIAADKAKSQRLRNIPVSKPKDSKLPKRRSGN